MPQPILESTPQTGRINQKMRTRRELLRGARELMQSGEPVTVAGAAKRVGISTATSYRYFSEPATMQVEAVMEMDLNNSDTLLEQLERAVEHNSNIPERLIAAQRLILAHIRENEYPYRIYIAKSHEQSVQGPAGNNSLQGHTHILALIDMALSPLRGTLSEMSFRRATAALAAICSPEHYFALKDTCGLRERDLDETSAQSLRAAAAHWLTD